MDRPKDPTVLKGFGCGLLATLVGVAWGLMYVFGMSANVAMPIAIVVTIVFFVIRVNAHHGETEKYDAIVDHEHERAKSSQTRVERACPQCGEAILVIAKLCKHCGSKL